MRITPFMLYDQLRRSVQNSQADYTKLSMRLGSQKQILSPSEDVAGAARALDYQITINSHNQFKRNIDGAVINLNLTSTVLSSFIDALSEAKGLVLASANGSVDAGTRAAYSQKAAQLRDQMAGLANTEVSGRYLFSGFRTATLPYAAGAFAYQGDNGVINVAIDRNSLMPMNVAGSDAFSYTLGAAYVKQIAGGLNVHYTPGAGTAVAVEIRDAADTVILDTFSFSNAMQMTGLFSAAVAANDSNRMQALVDPFHALQTRSENVEATVAARLSSLKEQSSLLAGSTNTLKDAYSSIMDVDTAELAMKLQKADTTLQALYATSAKIMSQSLLDFLK